jgi:6,7-dimethyl-8-ribityllumazine synthase
MATSSLGNTLYDLSGLTSVRESRIALIGTEWNDKIVEKQISGAKTIAEKVDAIISHEIFVPGSFELPYACKALWESTRDRSEAPQAIIAFGAVIRGGTPHFEYVCKAVVEGLVQLNIQLPIPVIFGVLTLDHESQAWERLGGAHGHKGEEAMITALKMIKLQRELIS